MADVNARIVKTLAIGFWSGGFFVMPQAAGHKENVISYSLGKNGTSTAKLIYATELERNRSIAIILPIFPRRQRLKRRLRIFETTFAP